MPPDLDQRFMRHALALARRQLGSVAPNPAVGCVLVKDDVIIARGVTADGGRPHAEVCALDMVGRQAHGATAYVTLEPCSHHGQSPPCAEALISAGVARVVVATSDPDPRVSGRGIAALKTAGIAIDMGCLRHEADHLNAGFFRRVMDGRPHFTLKLATSLDGRIALASGESQWVTGPQARKAGHVLRAQHDAILVGSQTILDDNPRLTCRLGRRDDRADDSARRLVRIILDARLRTPTESHVVQTAADVPTWIVTSTSHAARPDYGAAKLIGLEDPHDLSAVAQAIGGLQLNRVLIEGGGQVAGSFLTAGLVDELVQFTAPKALGSDARPAVAALDLANLGDAPTFVRSSFSPLGSDILASYVRAE